MIIEIIKLIVWALDDSKNKTVLENLRRQNEADQMAQWRAQQQAYAQQQAEVSQYRQPRAQQKPASAPPLPVAARMPSNAPAATSQRSPAANASAIARWAQPKTLRSQFILTEVLKPPLSLREANRRLG